MDKFEYGDLNRFLVSLGLALIVGSAAVLWLFFREPFDLARTVEQLHKLTPLAQQVVQQRQEWVAVTLRVLPYLTIAGTTLGIVLLLFGLIRWLPYQRLYEQTQILQRDALLRDLQPMTQQEILDKARTEVAVSQSPVVRDPETVTPRTEDSLSAATRAYLDSENTLLNTLASRLPPEFEFLAHQKLGPYTYDALLRPKHGTGPDYIIEFKKLDAGAADLAQAVRSASQAADWIGLTKRARQIPLIIGLIRDADAVLIENANRLIRETADHPTAFGRSLLRFITPARLQTLSYSDVVNLLDPAQRFLLLGDPIAAGVSA